MDKKKLVIPIVLSFALLVSAALVGYLSNTVTANITVESPMVVAVSEGKDSWAAECFPEGQATSEEWKEEISISGYGGETITVYTMSENIANAEITGFEEAIVTNWDGVTCEDFESVKVRVDSIYGDLCYGTEQELIGTGGCQIIDDYHIQFGSPATSTWGAGETDVSKIVATFKTDAKGTYTFSYRVIPE